jgi:transketolase
MIDPTSKLSAKVFAKDIPQAPTRDGFGHGTVEAGKLDPSVVVLCADLKESTRAEWFEKEFPDRYIEVGVAEQNLATVASGMAAVGKRPFIASYAAFSPGRNYEQIRTTIALNRQPVVVCGMHAGVSVGPDGATHQMLEDIGLMRLLPGMDVVVPGDAEEARKAVVAAARSANPTYIRFGRSPVATFTTPETPYAVGKALPLWNAPKPRVAIMATGALSYEALLAARSLDSEGIAVSVLHVPSVKPLDAEAVEGAARLAGRVLTVEEHQAAGGFGGAIAELLGERYPVPVVRLGMQDRFGESGEPAELLERFGLTMPGIAGAVRRMLGNA